MSIRTLPEFNYHAPLSIDETISLLEKYGRNATVMAGGTDVIPKMKGGVLKPEQLISLTNVKELEYINYDEENGLQFGASVTLAQLERNKIIRDLYPALYDGCHNIASTQIRNAGTLVGNICNAVPSADTAPALLVLGAKIKVVSKKGARLIPIEDFFKGVCKTVLEPEELVTEVQIPPKKSGESSIYYGFTLRKALDLAIVGVAVNLRVKDGICEDAKIALGAVAITPKRVKTAEALLIGQKITEELARKAGDAAADSECCPISDMRASKEYRRELVRVLIKDGILVTAGLKDREVQI